MVHQNEQCDGEGTGSQKHRIIKAWNSLVKGFLDFVLARLALLSGICFFGEANRIIFFFPLSAHDDAIWSVAWGKNRNDGSETVISGSLDDLVKVWKW